MGSAPCRVARVPYPIGVVLHSSACLSWQHQPATYGDGWTQNLWEEVADVEACKMGELVTLEGALTTLGEDGVRGLQIAIKEAGGKVVA